MTRDVTIRMPTEMVDALRHLAARHDVTPGQIIRQAVARELQRAARPAETPNRADEQLVASLQALLAGDVARATSWADLDQRLSAKGFRFQPAGGGVSLYDLDGTKLCKGSELGASYRSLVRRFGAPMPGHPHGTAGIFHADDNPLIDRRL
ncbi:hypothetical protein JANAI62_31480 [Jannaschia pagri]|uniref:Ribbon-helix-helix protein CopG domain-containing protein n=1 Tax=Jannaschia pagri TaxID=2829797 RepID=A0ABQ4NQG8_9RHOB|nr:MULTISPECIES: ribbon-helix-helix protein, CopG family [unclassified Jannaschia]GIT92615.1 hypothetical protein JANAI61_30730 [Jannaschia sp. AI_61]GIT96525.1 hypothetical protein JANAI62_31480 [Jannaschia sp. AI_62]